VAQQTNQTETGARYCYNYAVDVANIQIGGVTISGATASLMSGTNDGGLLEGAVVTLSSTPGISSTTNTTAGATDITIPFTLISKTIAPGTCTCVNTSCGSNKQNYTAGTCSN
jgi:hypothetical protein